MLTRREVLSELRRIGIKEPSLLKKYLEDFEHYVAINHGLKIASMRVESEEELFKKISPSI
jgi:hypothetical protein